MNLYIGLMSGTSLDGVDGVLVDLGARQAPSVLAHAHAPFDKGLRAQLLDLNGAGGTDELHRAALAAHDLGVAYASVVATLLERATVASVQIVAIGAHGQTVRHQPRSEGGRACGYTIQLLDGALLAELSGIDVICDFRSRDVAAGGQGAPLVPAFHAAMFASSVDRAVLNLGGIANLTLLPATGPVIGFDCGPANGLLDGWCERHLGAAFDDNGRFAASAAPDAPLLAHLLAEPYFALPPPKSTGRDLFNRAWLDAQLALGTPLPPAVVQSTLAALVASSVVTDLQQWAPDTRELFVCGGGAFNGDLMARLQASLPRTQVHTTSALGMPPDQVEACAFAWLADAFVQHRTGNLPAVTGARGLRPLGALYPRGRGWV